VNERDKADSTTSLCRCSKPSL